MRLLLVGAGHGHLHVLGQTRRLASCGLEVTLVAPDRFWYSGMGPGLLSGRYSIEDDTVDVGRLIERAGGAFVAARVERIDPSDRSVQLSDGGTLGFDLLSLNVGSEVAFEEVSGAADRALPVKPVRHLFELRKRWLTQRRIGRVAVVGGGPAGCEIAANIVELARTSRLDAKVTLITRSSRLLAAHGARAGSLVARWLSRRGVELRYETSVSRIDAGAVGLEGGENLPHDDVVMATGVRPPSLARRSGLACDREGALIVDQTLQSVAHPGLFGVGDAITLKGRPLARVGVYAVRQAPILLRNLLSYASGGDLDRFEPQRRFLLILNLGDGHGLMLYGGIVLQGRWVFRIKDWLDRRFVRSHQQAAIEQAPP
ncbi:MAG: FAD-dependent oxidoreductase [Acidobacteriota bacterium]|nr:MAG: FAD-dependent oxidoreductase [Acidobacteriota bacterium]